ncbi:rhamnulokinase [Gorillibacterium sp. sgz5001074]|uniref:rhamnulokinase n=1 Tax=Gorillibacterium sp. sgz5001074 TaxID=3446695 RepID=UPI003F6643DD
MSTKPIIHVLAFDLGASSGRAMVGTLDRTAPEGPVLRIEEVHRFPNEPVQAGGHLYWDILRLLHEMKTGFRKASEGRDIESFGIDTWGVDYGLLGEDGELLGNPYHYRDGRTHDTVAKVHGIIGQDRLFTETGLQPLVFNTVMQLHAAAESGSVSLKHAKELLFIPDLLLYLLTGVKQSEYTIASTSQLLHAGKQEWHEELLSELGIPADILKPVVMPGTVVGALSDEVCAELKLPPIRAVAVPEHDTGAAVVSVPSTDGKPLAYLICGTWSLLGTELADPVLDPAALALGFSNEGGMGGTARTLKNIMGLWLIQECKREWDQSVTPRSFAELVKLAEEAPAFRSFIDPDDLLFLPPGGMPDRIRRYCRETGQPVPETEGEITRCIYESLAMQYRLVLARLEALTGNTYGGLHMMGGGIQNKFLCRMTASAIGRPVWAGPVEASSLGNMAAQLIALGEVADMTEARGLIKRSYPLDIYEPEQPEVWDEAFERYLSITKMSIMPGK